MLVLSRKSGEVILVGEKISITVVRIAPGSVRIGIEAPDEFTILRQELKGRGQEKMVAKQESCP
jgi:carbon storage regulator